MVSEGERGLNRFGKACILTYPVLSTFAVVALIPILPKIATHFAETPNAEALVRSLVTIGGLALAISAPLMGAIANRLGWRRILVSSCILFGIAGAAGGLTDNLYLLILSRALVGVAAAAFSTLLLALLTMRYDGGPRNQWLGRVNFLGRLSALLLIPLAGILGEADWRTPIYWHAVGVLLVLPILAGIPEPTVQSASEAGEAGGIPWGLVGVGIVLGIVAGAPRLFIPFHLVNNGVTTPTMISLAMVAGAGSGAIVSFFYEQVRRKLSTRLTFILGFLFMGLGLGVVGMTHTFAANALGMLISGIGSGMAVPNLFAFAATGSGDRDRARDIGLAHGAFLAAPMLAQFGLEPLSKAAGPTAAVVALAVLALVAAAGFRLLRQDVRAAVATRPAVR
jgi:predicted MFS family arabinose efflux permease